MERIVKWLIKKYLPGFHLSKNPAKGRKNKKRNLTELEKNNESAMVQ